MNVKLIVIIAILATSALAHRECQGMPADMYQLMQANNVEQGFDVITQDHLQKRQEIAQSGNWRQMRIFFDLSGLNAGLQELGMSNRISFYKQVFEITGKWWESVLKVNDDRASIWPTILKRKNDSQIPAEKPYLHFDTEGRDTSSYDMFIRVNMGVDKSGGTLAYAGPYVRHTTTQRPISGTAWLTPYGDKITREHATPMNYSTDTMIHEFGHIFGFTSFKEMHPK